MPTSGGAAECMESIEKPLPPASLSTNTRLFKNLKVITLKFLSLYFKRCKTPMLNGWNRCLVFSIKLYVGHNLQSLFDILIFCGFVFLVMRLLNYELIGSCLLTFQSDKSIMPRR
jgi:hypothetical protein